jgi:hypothetical protein
MAEDPSVAKANLTAGRRAPLHTTRRTDGGRAAGRHGVGGGGFDLTNIDEAANEEIVRRTVRQAGAQADPRYHLGQPPAIGPQAR